MAIEKYRKILAMAIENEIAAHDFYKSICGKGQRRQFKKYIRRVG